MLDQHLDTLRQEFELESLATQTRGVYHFPLESGKIVVINDLPPGFTLHSTLIECPQANKESFLSELMFANLFGKGTNGAVLGLDEKGNMLTLSQTVEYTTNYKTFKELLEDFANTVDFWVEQALNHK